MKKSEAPRRQPLRDDDEDFGRQQGNAKIHGTRGRAIKYRGGMESEHERVRKRNLQHSKFQIIHYFCPN